MIKKRFNKKIEELVKEGILVDWRVQFNKDMKDPIKKAQYEIIAKEVEEENARLIRQRLAKKIKKARELSGKTQEELAKLMKTKKSYISKIESGKQNISVEYVVKVATALNRHVEIDIY